MDPHMTADDAFYLANSTHRRLLRPQVPLPAEQQVRKKKLVNFKIGRKEGTTRGGDDQYSHSSQEAKNRRFSLTDETIEEEELSENDRVNCEDIQNFNDITTTNTTSSSVRNEREYDDYSERLQEPVKESSSRTTERADAYVLTDRNHRKASNLNETVFKSRSPARRASDCFPLMSLRQSSTTSTNSWEKVKNAAATARTTRSSSLHSVVQVINARRKASLAPYIWTPSVPRTLTTPRPANIRDCEEKGSGTFTFSFVTKSLAAMNRCKLQGKLQQQQHQRGSNKSDVWDISGRQYIQWLKDVVKDSRMANGLVMKGLEIGAHYPVICRSPAKASDADGKPRLTRQESFFGVDCVLHRGVYEEVVSWVPELLVTCPSDPSQWARCFVILAFKTIDGEHDVKMEAMWREWTGALYVYCNIPDDLGLKKLTFYKRKSRCQPSLFTYMVLVEVDTVTKENCLDLLDFVYRMRMKNMTGYISVYQEYCSKTDDNSLSNDNNGNITTSSTTTTSSNINNNRSPLDLNLLDIAKISL